jgi:hypothetical protein
MKQSLTLALLIIVALSSSAQYFTMSANFTKVDKPLHSGRPLTIIEKYTSYSQGSKFVSRKVTNYNWSEKKINYNRYDKKNKLTHQVETGLDTSLKKVLYLVNTNHEPKGVVLRDTFLFSYNGNGHLTRMVANFNGQVNTADFKAGPDGHPIEAQVSNSQGTVTSTEKAVYHPDENYFAIAYKDRRNEGKLLHDTLRLDEHKYSPCLDEKMLVNEQGDITYQKRKGKNNRPGAEYENEYEYDSRGNWIRRVEYIFRYDKNGKRIRKEISRSEREITYQ